MSDPLVIDGSQLRQSRDSLGWSQGELAARACLSVKQVRQLEEGGSSSFYSENVKLTAAKKVAQILGLSDDELLGRTPVLSQTETHEVIEKGQSNNPLVAPGTPVPQSSFEPNATNTVHKADNSNLTPGQSSQPSSSHLSEDHLATSATSTGLHQGLQIVPMRSEVLHFLAQPPVDEDLGGEFRDQSFDSEHSQNESPASYEDASVATENQTQADAAPQTTEVLEATAPLNAPKQDTAIEDAGKVEQKKEPSSVFSNFLKIVIIFLLAIGVAFYFNPKSFEERTEAPPPLQVFPDSATTTQVPDPTVKVEDQNTPGSATSSSVAPSPEDQNNSGATNNPKPKAPQSNAPTKELEPKSKTGQGPALGSASGTKPPALNGAATSSDGSSVSAPPGSDAANVNKTAPQ